MTCLVVPGALKTLTGGFIYDRQIAEALGLSVIELASPIPTSFESRQLEELRGSVLFDGLCLPHIALDSIHAAPYALIHHPVSLETESSIGDWETRLLQKMRGIVTTSHHTADILRLNGVRSSRVRTVQPATDPVPIGQSDRVTGPPRLLCIASITPRKRHDLLLDAFEALEQPAELHLIGSSEFDPSWACPLLKRAATLGVEHRECVTEKERTSALNRADLFVFPSAYEGFGMAPVEAVRAGVPVVSTRAGALPEALPEQATIWVEASRSSVVAGIQQAMADLPKLTAAAREIAPTLRNWSTAANEFRSALIELGAMI